MTERPHSVSRLSGLLNRVDRSVERGSDGPARGTERFEFAPTFRLTCDGANVSPVWRAFRQGEAALRTTPLQAIGDETPPESASPLAPLWIALALIAAIAMVLMACAQVPSPFTGPARLDRLPADLFPKDAARCCDGNGSPIAGRGERR